MLHKALVFFPAKPDCFFFPAEPAKVMRAIATDTEKGVSFRETELDFAFFEEEE